MIGASTTFTTPGHITNHFDPSSSNNNDTAYIQTVIADLHMRYKSIFELCGGIGHKADACIIHGLKFIPESL